MKKWLLLIPLSSFIFFFSSTALSLTCATNSTGSFYGVLTTTDGSPPIYIRQMAILPSFAPAPSNVAPFSIFFPTEPRMGAGAFSFMFRGATCVENSDGSLTAFLTTAPASNIPITIQENSGKPLLVNLALGNTPMFVNATMLPDAPGVWQVTKSNLPAKLLTTFHDFTGTLTAWDNTTPVRK